MLIAPLEVERYKKIVFITGAGISKASGLPTYRGADGVWEKVNAEEVATGSDRIRPGEGMEAFREDAPPSCRSQT